MKNKKTINGEFSEFLQRPGIYIIIGGLRKGKTATAFSLAEQKSGLPKYLVGFPKEVPGWINVEKLEDCPNGGVVVVDESGDQFSSRRSMSDKNVNLRTAVALSAQRGWYLFFCNQSTRSLDIGILSDGNPTLIIKRNGLLSQKFERPEIKKIYADAEQHFNGYDGKQYSYVLSEDYEGIIETKLPQYWSENLSHAYAGTQELMVPILYSGDDYRKVQVSEIQIPVREYREEPAEKKKSLWNRFWSKGDGIPDILK